MQTYLAPKKRLIPLLVVCTIFLLAIPLALFLSPSHLLLVFDIFIPHYHCGLPCNVALRAYKW